MKNKMPPQIQHKEIRITDYLSLLLWQRQLRAILLTEDAWKVINGDLDKPTHTDPTDKLYRRDLDKWKKLNNCALGWMLLTLEDYSRQSIGHYKDPLDALRYLFKKFPPPYMTFEEFTDNDTPAPQTSPPGILIENMNSANRSGHDQRLEPRAETNRGRENSKNIAPNIAGVMELPTHPRSLRSPKKQAREETRIDTGRLTPNGIHNIITHHDLRSASPVSSGSNNTTRRKRFVEAMLRPKASFSNLMEERASLTMHGAEVARPTTAEERQDVGAHNDGGGSPRRRSRGSPVKDATIYVPERNVSLSHSDHVHRAPARKRRNTRGARQEDSMFKEGPYMMSGALQDVSHFVPQ